MPKYKFLILDSIYRGYRDHFPDIAIATSKFPISRYRDDRDLSVCLVGVAVRPIALIKSSTLSVRGGLSVDLIAKLEPQTPPSSSSCTLQCSVFSQCKGPDTFFLLHEVVSLMNLYF